MSYGLKTLVLGGALLLLLPCAWAQRASNWRAYRLSDGLAESACSSVSLSPQGKVLAGHPSAPFVSELDGYSLNLLPAPEPPHGRIFQSPGGQLWTVVPQGLKELRQDAWVLHPMPEIAAALASPEKLGLDGIPLYPLRQGHVLVLLPEQLLEFISEHPERPKQQRLRSAEQSQLGRFCALAPARDGGLWLSGARGLAKLPGPVRNLKASSPWQELLLPQELPLHNLSQVQEEESGRLSMVAQSLTNELTVLLSLEHQIWSVQPASPAAFQRAWQGPGGSRWALSPAALWQAAPGVPLLSENEELSVRHYSDAALEPSGAFWLATSDGLFRYAPLTWNNPGLPAKLNGPIRGLSADAEGRLWFLAGAALHCLSQGQHQEYPFPSDLLAALQAVESLYVLKNGLLLLRAGEQLFSFRLQSRLFSPVALQEGSCRFKPLGCLKDGSLCLGAPSSQGPGGSCAWRRFDGARLEPLLEPAPPEPSLLQAELLFTARNGDWWLSTSQGLAWRHENKWKSFDASDSAAPSRPTCFAELSDGHIWCASQEQLWEFDSRKWNLVRRGFERINALLLARDGSIWVGSDNGLHRFYQGAWFENGLEEGLPSASVLSLCQDPQGHLWVGTARGLSLYHPEADPDPPKTFLQNLSAKDTQVPEGRPISLFFSGLDRWKYTHRLRLLYSYRLDERDWSPFAEQSSVSFSDLPSGKHYFQVRAMDRNGNVDPSPAQLELLIIPPWYKERRLLFISVAGAAGALFFAGLAFNRHRRLLRSYLEVEKIVAERTRQLEVANRELLHSEKMNALGTLAAGIAHDFNNILSIIKGSAQLIEENLEQPDTIRTRVDRIKLVVEQGAGIVKAMLGFSRASEQPAAPFQVNGVLEDTLKLLGDRFLREVRIDFEATPGLPQVSGPRDFVQQILLNFILNAAESMSRPKRIVLSTARLDSLPAPLVLAPRPAPHYVAIRVQDFGCGISPENLARIFEPFFTTKALSSRRGTGLGLSMVYELAKKMEAGLAVESVPDKGSGFTLLLPATAPPDP